LPVSVDHDQRRIEVADIAARILVERGPDAVTFREIAAAAGFSTTVVSHYFKNKHDLLLYMFFLAAQRGADNVRAAMDRGEPPVKCIEGVMPLDAARRQNWNVVLAFWGKASTHNDFGAEQRRRAREMLGILRELFSRDADRDTSPADLNLRIRTVLTVVVGLATQAIFDPRNWPAHQQRAVIQQIFKTLGL
jgi:AcrR family transcriptional regulator